ncbi:MAG TPA: HAMP domain-containing sensor histidine kinase [Thermoanaerobaculia bacterium]|nr:HAMP domain-containing sensor histidine kinase [Thermoanaerobaculia bacterium]
MAVDESKAPSAGAHSARVIHVVFPANPAREHLSALAAELRARRDTILDAWRAYGDVVPGRNIAASLSQAQFNDHIPSVLESLSQSLLAWPDETNPITEEIETDEVSEHGLQRWQQGYSLSEVLREWGYLQMCVAAELERHAVEHPSLEPTVMPTARRIWAQLCADGVTASATQYGRLQQTESAGHVDALERALTALHTMEQSRAEAWRTAAHDLRGSVTVVKGAATLNASGSDLPEMVRVEVAEMLSKGVSSLNEMLNDLLSLARLEAGHEQRTVTAFDAAVLLRDFCAASQAAATDRGLFLKMDGPSMLPVEGDKPKVLRIVQNLLLNAVKYTERGGISVTWGVDPNRDTDRWTFSVQDTGPGIDDTDATTIAQDLHEATDVADDARNASQDRRRDMAGPATVASASGAGTRSDHTGEGVGLSIVKRLCELLDASLELATKPGHGSTFRVILPCKYEEGDRGTAGGGIPESQP